MCLEAGAESKNSKLMTQKKDKREERPLRRWTIRVSMWAAAVLVLFWVFRNVSPGETLDATNNIQPIYFASVVAIFCLFTLVLDSITHYWLFNRFNPPMDFMGVLRARGESYLLLSLGFIYGQGSMAYFVSGRTQKPLGEVTGSLFFLMFNNFLVLIIISTVSLFLFAGRAAFAGFMSSPEYKIVSSLLLVAWPICIVFLVFWTKDWDNPIRRRMKHGVNMAFDRARATDYLTAMALRSLQFVLWALFSWMALGAATVHISLSDLFSLGPIVGLAGAIPTPGRLGTSQGAWLLLFQHSAAPAALVAFSLLWSLGTSLARWIIGAVFLALGKAPGEQEG